MPKARATKRKKANPGVGIDFKKAKHKVGKKLPRAQNETETEIKSGKLFLAEQSLATDKSQVATTNRNNTLRELLSQIKHYSEKTRIKAINGLIELIREYPAEAKPNAAEIVAATATLASDPDKACRDAFVAFLRSALFPAIGEQSIQPFLAFLMAHTCSAMTHLSAAVRDSGIDTINVLLEFRPDLVGKGYFSEICEHYVEALGRSNRGRSLTAGSLKNLLAITEGCQTFLRATLPHVSVPQGARALGDQRVVREIVNGPVVLNRQQCEWGPASVPTSGAAATSRNLDTTCTADTTASMPDLESREAALAGKLVALLLDCWEECGLVSQEEEMEVAHGVRSNADRAKIAKASHATRAADSRNASVKKTLGEKCGVAILGCCKLIISKFKADVLSEESKAKVFSRIYPTYPNRVGCGISAAAADLLATSIAQLHESNRLFDQESIDALASWSGECLALDFSTGVSVSLAIMSFAGPQLRADMLRRAFNAWRDASDVTTKNLGLRMICTLVEPPFDASQLASMDGVLAAWAGDIPSLLWNAHKSASASSKSSATCSSSASAQYTIKLGLSALLHISRFVGSPASRKHLPALCAELDQLSIKIVPLFGLKIKEKERPGPLTKVPEALQTLAVEVLFNLPGLDNAVVGAVELSLSYKSPTSMGTTGRLLDLMYFKSQFGDPKKVWSFIFSAMERGNALDRMSRLALHCSPPGAAIRALVPPLLSKNTEKATCGALFFLRHCLTVFDDRDLGLERSVVEAVVQAAMKKGAVTNIQEDVGNPSNLSIPSNSPHDLGRDVILRLVRQCPSAIPTVFSFLPPESGSTDPSDVEDMPSVLSNHVAEALGALDLRPDVRLVLQQLDAKSLSPRIQGLLDVILK